MIARRLGNTWSSGIGGNDENTVLLLHGEDFVDSSANNLAITNTGMAISANGKFNNAIYCDSNQTSKVLTCVIPQLQKNYTIDFWLKYTLQDTCNILEIGTYNSGGLLLEITGSVYGSENKTLRVYIASSTGNILCYFGNMDWSVYHHFAIVSNNTNVKTYLDGTVLANQPASKNITGTSLRIMNASYYTSNSMLGYIDEFRISNIARWTDNFTPPDQPYS